MKPRSRKQLLVPLVLEVALLAAALTASGCGDDDSTAIDAAVDAPIDVPDPPPMD